MHDSNYICVCVVSKHFLLCGIHTEVVPIITQFTEDLGEVILQALQQHGDVWVECQHWSLHEQILKAFLQCPLELLHDVDHSNQETSILSTNAMDDHTFMNYQSFLNKAVNMGTKVCRYRDRRYFFITPVEAHVLETNG